ncbi:MAG: hypothetical protein M1812_006244 [Candelaria pacifica]|nr:MAG: hypothetical protein M1812_006244 [Candelaria pacifica]
MTSSPLTLTLGIELELYLKVYIPEIVNSDQSNPLLLVADPAQRPYLRKKFITRAVHDEMNAALLDAGFDAGWQQFGHGGGWLITDDSTITPPRMPPQDAQDWVYVGAELASPVLPFNTDSLNEITNVVNFLASKYPISTNESCGFHVHVGNSTNGFPLQTLKSFYTIAATYERQIQSIHPPHRLNNFFCTAISSLLPNMLTSAKAAIIAEASTVDDFVKLLTNPSGRYTAYNLNGLVNGPYRTIEFRQHAGTTNVAAVTNWVQFVVGLIAWAHAAGPHDVLSLVQQVCDNPDMEFSDLLGSLQMEHLIEFYRPRINTHRRMSWELLAAAEEEENRIRRREEREVSELRMQNPSIEERHLGRLQTNVQPDTHVSGNETIEPQQEEQVEYDYSPVESPDGEEDTEEEVAEMGTLTQDEIDEAFGSGVGDWRLLS